LDETMHDEGNGHRKGGIKGDLTRAERLAAELRANLGRRKARARKIAAGARKDRDGAGETGASRGCDGIPVVRDQPICDSNPESGRS
jgi:hypothetical protein